MRYRSTFGLKYLEIVRGTGPDAPEGFVFDGLNDMSEDPNFVGCDLPVDRETFSETIPEQAEGRLLPAADRVRRDREHVRQPRPARPAART